MEYQNINDGNLVLAYKFDKKDNTFNQPRWVTEQIVNFNIIVESEDFYIIKSEGFVEKGNYGDYILLDINDDMSIVDEDTFKNKYKEV